MTGEEMLKQASEIIAARRATYGDPKPFMETLAQRWSMTLGRNVTPSQVVLCLLDLKIARLANDPVHQDSICDLAGYAAILQEVSH